MITLLELKVLESFIQTKTCDRLIANIFAGDKKTKTKKDKIGKLTIHGTIGPVW